MTSLVETTRLIHEDIEQQIQHAISELSTELQSRKSLIQRDSIVKERIKQISANTAQLYAIYSDKNDVFKNLISNTIRLHPQKAFHKFDNQACELLYRDRNSRGKLSTSFDTSTAESTIFKQMTDFSTLFTPHEFSGKALDLASFHQRFSTLLLISFYHGFNHTISPDTTPDITHSFLHSIIHPLQTQIKSFTYKDFLQYFDDMTLLIPTHVKQTASMYVLNEYHDFLLSLKSYLLIFLYKINPLLDQDEIEDEIIEEYTTLSTNNSLLGWNAWDDVINHRQSKEYGILLVNYPQFNSYSISTPSITHQQYNVLYKKFQAQELQAQQQQQQQHEHDHEHEHDHNLQNSQHSSQSMNDPERTPLSIKTEVTTPIKTEDSTDIDSASRDQSSTLTTTSTSSPNTVSSSTSSSNITSPENLSCLPCDKTFTKEGPFTAHLIGKKHTDALKKYIKRNPIAALTSHSISTSAVSKISFHDTLKKTSKDDTSKLLIDIQREEFFISVLSDLLRPQITFTMNRYERKLTQTATELMMDDIESEDEHDIANSMQTIIDPKTGLPIQAQTGVVIASDGTVNTLNKLMTPDGRIIPAWLFRLHSFHMTYSCEICGGDIHRGERNFKLHFKDYKHTYMLKCLGITNNDLFVDVSKIQDALDLHDKIQKQQLNQLGAQIEEVEDVLGNVSTRPT